MKHIPASIYLYIVVIVLTAISCKKDDFNRREEWPVSGTENIDTGWFREELSDASPRYIDSEISLRYNDGGIIHSYTDGDIYRWRFIELSTGREVRFSYSTSDSKTHIISDPSLTVNGRSITLRHAKVEQDRNGTRWISMTTPDKSPIILVVSI